MTPEIFVENLHENDAQGKIADFLASRGFSARIVKRQQLVGFFRNLLTQAQDEKPVRKLFTLLFDQANPAFCFQNLETFSEASSQPMSTLCNNAIADLLRLIAAGPYPSSLLIRHPGWWNELSQPLALSRGFSPAVLRERFQDFQNATANRSLAAGDCLRRFHAFERLFILRKILTPESDVEETSRDLALLAEFVAQVGLETVGRELAQKKGAPEESKNAFFILGMGKLGGQELNFSSDIDVIGFYPTDQGDIHEPDGKIAPLSLHEYFTQWMERWNRHLSQVTAEGFVHRVDLRLRPEGSRGPLVNSIPSGERYYETWGTLWERAAYLKARPVAGDKTLAVQFLRALEPFIYRRHLDFHVLEEIRAMKEKIRQDQVQQWRRTNDQSDPFNVKLGEGGIREIEFLIQSHQLIHGGREIRLRSAHSLSVLKQLAALRLIPEAEAQDLSEAYRFLRKTEDLLQIHDNQQTHRLPADGQQLATIARFMGFPNAREYNAALQKHTQRVHETFLQLLRESEKPSPQAGHGTRGEKILHAMIQGWGTAKPQTDEISLLENTARVMEKIFSRKPEWRQFLQPLENFFHSVGRRSDFYHFLNDNPEITERLFDILAQSDFLAETLLKDIHLVYALDKTKHPNEQNSVAVEKRIRNASDRGEAMDQVRVFRNGALFQIGLADLFEQTSLSETQDNLSDLADTCIQQAAHWVLHELNQRYGQPLLEQTQEPADCAVLGLGTLGARELNYKSDLDLIFVYEGSGETDGQRTISNGEFFTLFAQRLISFLTTATAKGTAYSIDTRLRPSGRAGTLITSREAFRRYHLKQSQIWEIQALLRSRIIFATPTITSLILKDLQAILFEKPPLKDLAQHLHNMRQRMEKERANVPGLKNSKEIDLKLGPGGLTDIEFATQFLQLRHHGPFCPHTRKALEGLRNNRHLPPDQAQILCGAYDQYRLLANRLCLACNRNIDHIQVGQPRLDEVARSLGFNHAPSLLEFLQQTAREVRKIYLDILGISA